MCAQLVHAAGETGPVTNGTHAVVLGVSSEWKLSLIEQQLAEAGIAHQAIREPDEPWCGALMALGLSPTRDRGRLRPILGRLRLVKEAA